MKRWIIFLCIGAIVYIPLVPAKQHAEFALIPDWVVGTQDNPSRVAPTDSLVPFRNETEFGYVTTDGALFSVDTIFHNVALNSSGYVNYSSIGTELVFQSPVGTIEAMLPTRGYAHFFRGRLFVLATNASRIEEWSTGGELIWERDFGSLITSIDVRAAASVVGLLDGRVQVQDAAGNIDFEETLSGSHINAVYGCALGNDERTLAVVHGLSPQKLSVFERRENQFIPIQTVVLENEFRRVRMMFFAPGDEYVFLEDRDGIVAFAIYDNQFVHISLRGKIVDFGTVETDRVLWIASETDTRCELVYVTEMGVPVFADTFRSNFVEATQIDARHILGVESHVGALTVSAE